MSGNKKVQIPLYPVLELSEALGCALFNCKFIVKTPTQKRQSVLNPLQGLSRKYSKATMPTSLQMKENTETCVGCFILRRDVRSAVSTACSSLQTYEATRTPVGPHSPPLRRRLWGGETRRDETRLQITFMLRASDTTSVSRM